MVAPVGAYECKLIRQLPLHVRLFDEDCDLVRQGDTPTGCCLILDGLAARYMFVRGGRQILSLHFSGDLPDLQGLHLEHMDHGIYALTPVRAAFIPHSAVRSMIRSSPEIADLLIRLALIDAAIFRQWIANIGRRSAFERIAHVFCESFLRMRTLNLVEEKKFFLPITQVELGDATGLSQVHVNRVLQRMRADDLIISKGNEHAIVDWERLCRAADFNKRYLHLRE